MAENSQDNQEDKTEDPTPQRMEEFRKEGQVSQSRELTAFFVLGACLLTMYFAGPGALASFFEVFKSMLAACATTMITDENIGSIMLVVLKIIGSLAMPVAIAGFVAGILGSIVQIGFNISLKPISPELEKINPITGFWRIYSLNSLVEGFKSLLKLCVIGGVAYWMVSDSFESSSALPELESQEILNYLGSTSFRLIGAIAIALFMISILDVAYQKYRHYKQLMMTKQELRNEIKQREGDPLLRARIRSVQREIAHKRMMEEVKKADVIVTNPTHIAVAIRYDLQKMNAPKVVAKGSDFIALNIKDLAKKHNVPVVENVPLARALHKSVKVGAYIPRALYQAVAEVLAFVYRLRGRIGRKK